MLAGFVALAPSRLSATPTLLFDNETGKVLYAEDQDMLWHPASLTKIMTAYLAFEAMKARKIALDDKLIVSDHAHSQPPSKIGLPIGRTMSLKLGLEALMVKSANDVAVMIGEHIAGTEAAFVKRMNATAKRLGMTRTRFFNANGLPHPDQVTTARDMGLLARALLRDFPEQNFRLKQTHMRIGKRRLRSYNDVLRLYKGGDGIKTGFICASGYNIVASATREGRRMVAVVLGAKSAVLRRERTISLLDYGFESYPWKSLFSAVSLEKLPFDRVSPKGPQNIRRTVRSYACGYRGVKKRRKGVKRKKKKAKAKRKKNNGTSFEPG